MIVGTFRSVDASADEVFCDTVVMTLVTLGPCGCSTWNISFSLKLKQLDIDAVKQEEKNILLPMLGSTSKVSVKKKVRLPENR